MQFSEEQKASRYFTPSQAVKTLPLVRSIVQDILLFGKQLRERILFLQSEGIKDLEHDEDCIAYMDSLEDLYNELQELGCEYKDWNFSIGLVDFPAIHEGREILLCWKSDEETINHYHGRYEGFADRKVIPDSWFSTENEE